MRVYIANLGKYNEGELVGAWFIPPIDIDDMKEKIGLNSEYEEYAIHDYELPFDIGEYIPISEINRLCALAEELQGTPIEREIKAIQQAFFGSFEELVEHVDDIICYPDCNDMADVARYLIEETGTLSEIPDFLRRYIDYESYGRDLEISGFYLVTSNGVFEYCT